LQEKAKQSQFWIIEGSLGRVYVKKRLPRLSFGKPRNDSYPIVIARSEAAKQSFASLKARLP
jgi:hypothetical protein